MKQTSSWEANSRSSNRNIRTFYGTKRFITELTQNPPQGSVLNQMIPDHIPTPYFFKILFNIILSSKFKSPKWPLSFRSGDNNFVCISHLFLTCYTHHTSHTCWEQGCKDIWHQFLASTLPTGVFLHEQKTALGERLVFFYLQFPTACHEVSLYLNTLLSSRSASSGQFSYIRCHTKRNSTWIPVACSFPWLLQPAGT